MRNSLEYSPEGYKKKYIYTRYGVPKNTSLVTLVVILNIFFGTPFRFVRFLYCEIVLKQKDSREIQ